MRSGRHRYAPLVLAAIAFALSAGLTGPARAGEDDGTSAARLEGVVLDVGGAPAGGAAVLLTGRDVRRESPADAGGRFFLDVEPGVYLVSATAGSIESQPVRVEIRDGETPPLLTLMLRPPLPVEQFAACLSPFDAPFASMPIAGRIEVFLAGENLLDDRFETGRTPVVNLGPPPNPLTTGARLRRLTSSGVFS